ncbi:BCCT family transporter [Rhabdobacter roseus]|uniref:Choline-glycine betaine transporter n=2 Tax=Rhabdobacter roseus TaxID=1655419 RepID=A0A840TVM3_9BACT|nr:choline-glycine betaine transporter [Rhabdobacter roseus]
MSSLRHRVFWPPFIILILVCGYSLLDPPGTIKYLTELNAGMMGTFGWLFSVGALGFFLLCVVVYLSPLGRVRIGGAGAVPLLNRWRWFAITLCTTIATGILFWGTAEPLFHLHAPPPSLGLRPNSHEAGTFAVSTMYLHWSLIPYGIYTLAGLMFALTHYNLHQPFSLGSMLYPVLGQRAHTTLGSVIDAACLFCLVAGMAASLGAGILILAGGLEQLAEVPYGVGTLGAIALVVVAAFVVSAASGLMRGIRVLSEINVVVFAGLALFIFAFGPTAYLLSFGGEALGEFFQHFLQRSLIGTLTPDTAWARSWTIFNWTNWLAWTPITALFLGRIAVGYTVRDFIHFNLLLPSLFACLWIMIFSGSAIQMDHQSAGSPLYQVLNQEGGASRVIFALLARLPFSELTSFIFLGAAFLSYVTAADSNTAAMSSISTRGTLHPAGEPPVGVKVSWGILIGLIAWVMVSFAGEGKDKGLDGVKILSNLGGFPALILMLFVAWGMIKLMWKTSQLFGPDADPPHTKASST